jgi:hypothetical protein
MIPATPDSTVRPQRSEPLALIAVFIVLTWAWVMLAGRDLGWDVLNHHVYLPFSLLSGRFQADLLAAGPQSYQNPVGYVPFYGLLRAGLPNWMVGTVLSVLHALAVVPLLAIAQAVWGEKPSVRLWRWLAVAMAWASPVFLLTVGTSSIDPVSNLLVMLALAAVLHPRPRTLPLCGGAVALGLAVAMKPTAALFALALGAVLLIRLWTHQMRWVQGLSFVAAATASTLVFWAPWAYWLWTEFHNPIFPLYNQIFHSPLASTQPVVDRRFLPDGWQDWLLRPWRFAEMRRFATIEAFAPDLRPLALCLAGFALLVSRVLERSRPPATAVPQRLGLDSASGQLLVFAVVSFVLWMKISGNARYVLPLLAVFGVLLVRVLQLAFPLRWARSLALLLLVLQLFNYSLPRDFRLSSPQPWDNGPYLDIRVPDRLRQQPFLHVSLGLQTYAAVAMVLHPDGALINAVGQMNVPPSGPLRDVFGARVAAWQGRTRFLFAGSEASSPTQTQLETEHRVNRLTQDLGLQVDWSDCERVSFMERDAVWRTLLSCKAVPRASADPAFLAARTHVDQAFAALERRCPQIYGPPASTVAVGADMWQRYYSNLELRVTIDANDDIVVSHHRSMDVVRLGTVVDAINGRGEVCTVWKLLSNPS